MKELEKVIYKFAQEGDCCQKSEDYQELFLETHDNGCGKFFTISTDRWAMDDDNLESFIEALRDFFKTHCGINE